MTAGPATVLIVEDSAIQAELLRRTVSAAGYTVLVARDGAEGLALARANHPAAVVSDVTMPVMNGFELCSRLRQDPALCDTPVILLTALSEAKDVVHGLNAGADCYVTKPYHGAHLVARLTDLLAKPPQRHEPALDLSVTVGGTAYAIHASARQILDLLVLTYEGAVQQNRQLAEAQDALSAANRELEDKVRARTRELETVNESLNEEIHRREALETQLRELALLDPLTGLYNRRLLEEAMLREAARARRDAQPLGVIMIDIDHFKRINDQHGHAGGDLVLKWLGQFLRTSLRAEDVACRYGGEEFMMLLPGASSANLLVRAEQIRVGVQTESLIDFNGQRVGPITVSLGLAMFYADTDGRASVTEAMEAADAALYRAKQQGRNQTALASTMDPPDLDPLALHELQWTSHRQTST